MDEDKGDGDSMLLLSLLHKSTGLHLGSGFYLL